MAGNAGLTPTISPADVFTHALDNILTDSSRWTQHTVARTSWNDPVPVDSEHASKFCLVGGCYRSIVELCERAGVYDQKHNQSVWDLRERVMGLMAAVTPDVRPEGFVGLDTPMTKIPPFNDDNGTTFEDVRMVLKDAREKAEG